MAKNLPAIQKRWVPPFILGSGRSPDEVNGNLLQYSCLENSMDGGAWQSMGSQRVGHDCVINTKGIFYESGPMLG